MILNLSPARSDAVLRVERRGDTLLIDGESFDFSGVPEGAMLPGEAVASDWIPGPVERIAGRLHIGLICPHGADAPQEARFPVPVEVDGDGPVILPGQPLADETGDPA